MSLRYKALIAVLLLVGLVTGGLGYYVSNLYRDAESKRIRDELERDAKSLNLQLATESVVVKGALENASRSGELVFMFNSPEIELKNNLDTYAGEWRQAVDADYALAAIDSFTAEERKASVLKPGKDVALVALVRRPDTLANPEMRAAILESPELASLVQRAFDQPDEKDEKGRIKPKASRVEVLALGGRVFLAVASPLYSSLQEFAVVGVGAVLIELSSQRIKASRIQDAQNDNPIEQVIVAAGKPTAATFKDPNTAQSVGRAFLESTDTVFNIDLDTGDGSETFVCRAASFDLATGDARMRPSFVALKSLDKELRPLVTMQQRVGLAGLIAGTIGAAIAYAGAYLVIRKLRRLQNAADDVRAGKFDTQVLIKGRDELGALGDAFNKMTTGLKALGIYTDHKLATTIMRDAKVLVVEGAREEGSIFFSDVKGFTGITERLNAAQLVTLLGEYFTELSDAVKAEGGYVDKFIGDAVMAYWGPPFVKDASFAKCACRAAVLCMRAAAKLRERWKAEGKPPFFQRIGIATGEVTVGNIGSATKKNFTVIGDSVNLASRLEGANKLYKTEILIDERTAELAREVVLVREIDQIRVVGKLKPVRVFELLSLSNETNGRHIKLCKLYGEALAAYREKKFEAALAILENALAAFPDDGPSAWLKARCLALLKTAPEAAWEAVTTATEK